MTLPSQKRYTLHSCRVRVSSGQNLRLRLYLRDSVADPQPRGEEAVARRALDGGRSRLHIRTRR